MIFLRGLFLEGLVFGGAYIRNTSKEIYRFSLLYFVFKGNFNSFQFQVQATGGGGGLKFGRAI